MTLQDIIDIAIGTKGQSEKSFPCANPFCEDCDKSVFTGNPSDEAAHIARSRTTVEVLRSMPKHEADEIVRDSQLLDITNKALAKLIQYEDIVFDRAAQFAEENGYKAYAQAYRALIVARNTVNRLEDELQAETDNNVDRCQKREREEAEALLPSGGKQSQD